MEELVTVDVPGGPRLEARLGLVDPGRGASWSAIRTRCTGGTWTTPS